MTRQVSRRYKIVDPGGVTMLHSIGNEPQAVLFAAQIEAWWEGGIGSLLGVRVEHDKEHDVITES